LPVGEYLVEVVKAEIKPTKNGTGQYINLRLDVSEGKFANRVLWAIINIKNASEAAERIGRAQLGDIMRAVGLSSLSDTDQLIGAPLLVKVGQREYNGEMQNDVKAFKSASDNALPVAKLATPAATGGAKKAPWAK
jgi:hypothetical protein